MKSIAMLALVLLLVAGGSCSASAQEVKSRQDVLAELAAIELRVTVDRDFAGAEAALVALEAQCTETGQAGVLADPVVDATRVRIRSAIEAARRDDGADLQESVAEALRGNDEITLLTLGTRAAAIIRDTFGRPDSPLAQANVELRLDWMFRLDPAASLGFFQADPMRLGPDNIGAVLNVIVARLPWIVHEGRPPVLERPEWLDCIAVLLEHPSALTELGNRRNSIHVLKALVGALALRDAFTPRLVAGVTNLMAGMDGYAVLSMLDAMDDVWAPSAQPIFERFVVDERVAVRNKAAWALMQADSSPGLRSRVHDPDTEMRLRVVDSLGPRDRGTAQWFARKSNPGTQRTPVPAAGDAEARALLATLAADPEPAVRERCVYVLDKLPQPLDPGVYRALARDGDPLVRTALSQLKHPDARLQTELLVTLAGDGERRVVESVEQRLGSEVRGANKWKTDVDAWMPVLIARLDNTRVSLDRPYLLSGAMNSPAARRACTQLALDRNDPAVLEVIATYAVFSSEGEVSQYDAPREWSQLAGPDLARLLPLLQSVSEKLPVAVAVSARGGEVDASVPAALDPLARDDGRPARFRLAALGLALHEPTPDRLELLRQLLSSPSFAPGSDESKDDTWAVSGAVGGVQPSQRNAVVLDVLAHVPLRDELRVAVLKQCSLAEPGAEAVGRLLLEQDWVDRWEVDGFVKIALTNMAKDPALADEDSLRRATRSASHASTAVQVLARLRDPRFLVLLTECLDPTWIPTQGVQPNRDDIATDAVDALQGYMSDDAASILLNAAANSPNAIVREKALAAVEAIGRYRDALAAWQRRTTMTASRDAAIGQLTAIAADSSLDAGLRAEALRGLGTLQAVEQMPLIIHALSDADVRVVAAARAALERLNAASGGVPQQAEGETKPR